MTACQRRNGPLDSVVALLTGHAMAWRDYATVHPMIAMTAFVLVYAAAVVAFLPVALVLTALGGYLFGVAPGTALSVLGATLGGLISYSLARTALSDWVHRRFDARPGPIQRLLRGIRSGAFDRRRLATRSGYPARIASSSARSATSSCGRGPSVRAMRASCLRTRSPTRRRPARVRPSGVRWPGRPRTLHWPVARS